MSNVQRFSAIDGRAVDPAQLIESNTITPDLDYTEGAMGCALSHIFFWEAAVSQNAVITVCEDDAIFHESFQLTAAKLINSLPVDWDFVMWGWNFDSILLFDFMPGISPCLATFNQEQMRSAVGQFQSQMLSPQLYRLHRGFGTICYTVSASGASKLLASSLPVRPLTVSFPMINPAFPNNGIDIVMNDAYPRLNAFVCFPPLVLTTNDHATSTVRATNQTNHSRDGVS